MSESDSEPELLTFQIEIQKHVVAPPQKAERVRIRPSETLKTIKEVEENEVPLVVYGKEIDENVFVIRYYFELKRMAAEIGKQAIVGVLFGGRCVSRFGHVTWIVISTEHKVFHVDITGLARQTPMAWDLLENEIFSNKKLLKVIHDCRRVADYLTHQQNIVLKNVFDTQVADAVVLKNATGVCIRQRNTLASCLEFYHLEVPHETLEDLQVFENENISQSVLWGKRPMPDEGFMKLASLMVKYLLPLHDMQFQKLNEKLSRSVDESLEVTNFPCGAHWFMNPMLMSPELMEIINGTEPNSLAVLASTDDEGSDDVFLTDSPQSVGTGSPMLAIMPAEVEAHGEVFLGESSQPGGAESTMLAIQPGEVEAPGVVSVGESSQSVGTVPSKATIPPAEVEASGSDVSVGEPPQSLGTVSNMLTILSAELDESSNMFFTESTNESIFV